MSKMTKIFLTGCRDLDPVVSVVAVSQTLLSLSREDPTLEVGNIFTGDLGGVESAVRYLLPQAQVVESSALDSGKPDLDARHEAVADQVDVAVFLHPDPFDSRILKSLMEYFDDDALVVVPLG
jgi:hypothetical protein